MQYLFHGRQMSRDGDRTITINGFEAQVIIFIARWLKTALFFKTSFSHLYIYDYLSFYQALLSIMKHKCRVNASSLRNNTDQVVGFRVAPLKYQPKF